ncbi:hypothetical protein [Kitasatospora aureofaciens]|uniref:hypothetical protein n=1 Tax=Kitasatospora aureofaciens TaxID=1894 RepID=UPI0036F45BB0
MSRRSFHRTLGSGAGAAALSLTGLQGVAGATPAPAGPAPVVPAIAPGTHTSFPVLKQVTAGLLDVGYAELGPADGPVVLCLHGWPYAIHPRGKIGRRPAKWTATLANQPPSEECSRHGG